MLHNMQVYRSLLALIGDTVWMFPVGREGDIDVADQCCFWLILMELSFTIGILKCLLPVNASEAQFKKQ